MKTQLTQNEMTRTKEILAGLVVRNIQNGSNMEEAKSNAFNVMNRDYPQILGMFLNQA